MDPKTTIHTVSLTVLEGKNLRKNLNLVSYPENGAYEDFLSLAAQGVSNALSAEHLGTLRSLSVRGEADGPVVICGLPFDHSIRAGLIDPEVIHARKPSDLSEAILAGIVRQIGEPYAISLEGHGLISHLSPKQSHLKIDTGIGALNVLDLHIENAAARALEKDKAPGGLALIGVADDPADLSATIVADGRLALAQLNQAHFDILFDPERFEIKFPVRWRDSGLPAYVRTAIAHGHRGRPSFSAAFYGGMTAATDTEAAIALEAFKAALDLVAIDLRIRPGQLVLLDNHVLFHGRRAFKPTYDALGRPRRLLQRLFWTSSLDRFAGWPVTDQRIFTPSA